MGYSGSNTQNYVFQKQEFLDETNWINFKYRPYDPSIAKFIQIDRLSQKYAFMSPYQFSSNNPVVNVEIDGLEGLHYTEKQSDGTEKQVVEKNVVVLTQRPKEIPTNASEKQIAKIERQNARIAANNEGRVAAVKKDLNDFYSGATDESGNSVDFRFNVTTQEDNVNQNLTTDERNAEYGRIAKNNGLEGTKNGSILNVPAAVITRESASTQGLTTGAKIIRMSLNAPQGGIAHEVIHTFGLQDNGYQSGGILHSPPQQIISNEVKQIKKISYAKRN